MCNEYMILIDMLPSTSKVMVAQWTELNLMQYFFNEEMEVVRMYDLENPSPS